MFRDWDDIIEEDFVANIPEDPPLPRGAVLIKSENRPQMYLIDLQGKRWVTSPEAMDRYHFKWDAWEDWDIPDVVIDRIPLVGMIV